MSKIEQIKAIIDARSITITGDYVPNKGSLDEIDAALPKYLIKEPSQQESDSGFVTYITYPVLIEASSQDNLESLIHEFISIHSDNADGYEFSIANYPHRIEVNEVLDDDSYLNEYVAEIAIIGMWEI